MVGIEKWTTTDKKRRVKLAWMLVGKRQQRDWQSEPVRCYLFLPLKALREREQTQSSNTRHARGSLVYMRLISTWLYNSFNSYGHESSFSFLIIYLTTHWWWYLFLFYLKSTCWERKRKKKTNFDMCLVKSEGSAWRGCWKSYLSIRLLSKQSNKIFHLYNIYLTFYPVEKYRHSTKRIHEQG
jgi:hypothetical protein